MIIGNGPLANGARETMGDPPFCWILAEPPLPAVVHDILGEQPDGRLCVLSTPAPVGTLADLEALYPRLHWAVVPENVRLNHPEDWLAQARFVIGTRIVPTPIELLVAFTPALVMSPESAEMVKHALNGFLAVSVAYAKEIAYIARAWGAEPVDVAQGVMTDPRIGKRAYLLPEGEPGSHLLREVENLIQLGAGPLLEAAR